MSKAIVPVRPLELLVELPMGGSRLFAGQFELGLSLSQILARLSGLALPVSYFKHIAIYCQGASFDPQNWHRIKPKKAIKIVIKPQDDPQAAERLLRIGASKAPDANPRELAAYSVVANLMMNLDEVLSTQ